MNSPVSQEIFQQNLTLLNQVYPQYSSMITSVAGQPSPYTFELEGENYYTCKFQSNDEAYNHWIHGPQSPWEHAQKVIQDSGWNTQQQFILFRPSLGYFAFTLYPNLRKGRNAQRMLLIEDRIDLFVESIKRFDWTDLLRSDRVILLLNEKPVEAAHEFVRMNPVSILPQTSVMCGCNENDEEKQLMGQLRQVLTHLSQTVNNASKEYLDELKAHYKQIQNDPNHKTKVVLVNPEHDYLADSIESGLSNQGCEYARFTCNQRLFNFLNPYIWLVYTREHYPDVLFWMNRNTLSPEGYHILSNYPIKKVLWFLDNPKRVETTAEELEATDFIFSFDPSYLPYLKELSGKEGYYLPNAAGIDPLPECAPDAAWPNRKGPPVSFVGALAASRFQEVRNYWLNRDPEFVEILDGIVEDYLAEPSRSLEERYEQTSGPERLPFSGFVVLYLEEKATYLLRLKFLKAVAGQGLSTYGTEEWANFEWASELTACYSGQTPHYRKELPGVYYHSHINVNVYHVQCVNSSNPRNYDALAAGGFLLSEYRPALEEEFEIGTHLDCFRTPQELKEKTEYYLEHPKEREAIARAGQKHVLENGTYGQRAQTMMNILYPPKI